MTATCTLNDVIAHIDLGKTFSIAVDNGTLELINKAPKSKCMKGMIARGSSEFCKTRSLACENPGKYVPLTRRTDRRRVFAVYRPVVRSSTRAKRLTSAILGEIKVEIADIAQQYIDSKLTSLPEFSDPAKLAAACSHISNHGISIIKQSTQIKECKEDIEHIRDLIMYIRGDVNDLKTKMSDVCDHCKCNASRLGRLEMIMNKLIASLGGM